MMKPYIDCHVTREHAVSLCTRWGRRLSKKGSRKFSTLTNSDVFGASTSMISNLITPQLSRNAYKQERV